MHILLFQARMNSPPCCASFLQQIYYILKLVSFCRTLWAYENNQNYTFMRHSCGVKRWIQTGQCPIKILYKTLRFSFLCFILLFFPWGYCLNVPLMTYWAGSGGRISPWLLQYLLFHPWHSHLMCKQVNCTSLQ